MSRHETMLRPSFTVDAHAEYTRETKDLDQMSNEEVIMLGLSTLLHIHEVGRKYLSPTEIALRHSLNRRLP